MHNRTDSLLPPSFDLVVLGKKEVENVKSVGRNPYRKESDVINGIPVNTMLQPDLPQVEAPLPQEPVELLQQGEAPLHEEAIQPDLEPVPIQHDPPQPEYIQADPPQQELVEG